MLVSICNRVPYAPPAQLPGRSTSDLPDMYLRLSQCKWVPHPQIRDDLDAAPIPLTPANTPPASAPSKPAGGRAAPLEISSPSPRHGSLRPSFSTSSSSPWTTRSPLHPRFGREAQKPLGRDLESGGARRTG